MGIHYTFDADLDTVLQAASNEDLAALVQFIKAASRTENLTTDDSFVRFYPDHTRYAHVISAEIRNFGGHTVANMLRRGKGPDYRTVVCDVLEHLKISFEEQDNIFALERRLLAHVLKDMYGQMDEEQRNMLVAEIGQYQNQNASQENAIVVSALESGDFRLLSPKARLFLAGLVSGAISRIMGVTELVSVLGNIVGNSVNRMLTSLEKPMDWLVSALNSIIEFGGPAWRVTVPCVIHVAMLRVKQSSSLLEYRGPKPGDNILPRHSAASSTGTEAAAAAAAPGTAGAAAAADAAAAAAAAQAEDEPEEDCSDVKDTPAGELYDDLMDPAPGINDVSDAQGNRS
ncbi:MULTISPECIES: ubiquinol-cytochrome C chaperone family protein [unclassified Anaerobiospirillum]|uniref:ubiquinol-cytochrome C chaperone family protein n=1 Tax=unclassified Anaerobiospirillum TaxID=2647410 RepID=UPI001FF5D3ED|nr:MULTISPECIES: ubiquinol-cytochrome C chaperone family protein [unclassified Anaerobiospirillum]MCK0535106.1 hypothetical protein [Anaerobiospirillum sp. NML120511]MCK0540972.1 hypothetical protein [Anaerobiospirillum sp. NML02-A-032]